MQTGPMPISDQQLSAYLDGELPADQQQIIAQALRSDRSLQQRLQQLEQASQVVKQTYSSIDKAPLPESVLAMLRDPHVKPERRSSVGRFNDFIHQTFGSWLPAAGMAAALAVGILIGGNINFWNTMEDTSTAADQYGLARIISADAPLFAVLENTPSATSQALTEDYSVTPILSFQTRDGVYCREFRTASAAGGMHSVACRGTDQWNLQVTSFVGNGATNGEYYVTAGAADSYAINQFVDQHMRGDALGAAQEQAVIQQGWRQ